MSSKTNSIIYVSAEDILVIHAKMIDEVGGSHGVREVNLLQSAAVRAQTTLYEKEMFLDVFQKGGAYLDALAHHHVFTDGSKRTAFASTVRFLFVNGYEFNAPNEKVVEKMVDIATNKPPIDEIAEWLKKHSRPTRKKRP